jgi:hypothetical protein
MKKNLNVSKKIVAQVIIEKINETGKPVEIKTNYQGGYESPQEILWKGNNKGYIPDIVVNYKDESDIYEIELDNNLKLDKWKLFYLSAKKNDGNLYLVMPDYLKDQAKKMLENSSINATIVYFQT